MNTFPNAKKLVLLVMASLAGFTVQAEDMAVGSNVESLLSLARENNPEVALVRYEAAAASERVIPAGALPDPRFRTELQDITRMGAQSPSLLPGRVGSTRYLLMQDVPWFGKRTLKQEIAELEAESLRQKAAGTWREVAARVKTTYAQWYFLHRNQRLMQDIITLMTQLEKIAQSRYAGGLGAQQDVIRAQLEQTRMRTELLELQAEQHHMQTKLNALLGRSAMAPLAAPEKLRPMPSSASLDYTLLEQRISEHNPLLSAEEASIQAAEKNQQLSSKNRYPDFTFGISPVQYGSRVQEWELMVELNIPLQQSSRDAQEREAAALLAAARARRSVAENQLMSELAENLTGLESARRSEELTSKELLPQSELMFQSALAGYETGKVDFATLLDAQLQIRQAKQSQIKAQAESQARLADIERLLGEDL